MLRLILLIMILPSAIACHYLWLSNYPSESIAVATPTTDMPAAMPALIKNVTVTAIEWQSITGRSVPSPETASATVFLHIENPLEANLSLIIEAIEIQDVNTEQVQLTLTTPTTIELRPLEHAVYDFRLASTTNFSAQEQVKAIVTYRVDERQYRINSLPTTIQR